MEDKYIENLKWVIKLHAKDLILRIIFSCSNAACLFQIIPKMEQLMTAF